MVPVGVVLLRVYGGLFSNLDAIRIGRSLDGKLAFTSPDEAPLYSRTCFFLYRWLLTSESLQVAPDLALTAATRTCGMRCLATSNFTREHSEHTVQTASFSQIQPNAATRCSAIKAAGRFLSIFAGSTACVLALGVLSFFRHLRRTLHSLVPRIPDVRLLRSAKLCPLRSSAGQYLHCYLSQTAIK